MDKWTLSALESYSSSAGIMINFNQWECHWKNTRERKTLYQPICLQYEVTNYKCNRSGGICTAYGKCVGVRVPSAGVIGNTPVTGVIELSSDTRTSTRAAWTKANNKLLFECYVRSEPEKQEYTKVNIWKECEPKEGLKGVIEQQLADQVRSSWRNG